MLVISIIGVMWLAGMVAFVAICKMAQKGDRAMSAADRRQSSRQATPNVAHLILGEGSFPDLELADNRSRSRVLDVR